MEPKDIAKKAVLGVLGLALLGMLWGKVRAAQGLASPSPAAVRYGKLRSFGGMDMFVSGASSSLNKDEASFDGGIGGGGVAALRGRADAPAEFQEPASEAPVRRPVPAGVPRKIVRNASAQFEVKNHEEARRKALEIAARHGAEVSQDDTYEQGGCKVGTLGFRVAPDRLDSLLKDLEPLGRVLHRSVSMQNLTEEYVDLQSRLVNMRKVEKRLTDLLAFNTHRLRDVLEVEKEVERVGQEIERLLGRMKYIDSLAAQSMLSLSLREPSKETSQAPGLLTRIGNSVMRAFNTFLTTGLTLLDITCFLLAVGLWASPLAGLLWLGWRRFGPKNG